MIKEICQYIESNTAYQVGIDLFEISINPDSDIDECTVIAEPNPGLVDGLLTDKRFIPLVAYSRALTRFTARDNAYIVFNLLHGTQQVSLDVIGSGYQYVCNFECRTPYYMGLDESGRRHVFATPIDVTVTNML